MKVNRGFGSNKCIIGCACKRHKAYNGAWKKGCIPWNKDKQLINRKNINCKRCKKQFECIITKNTKYCSIKCYNKDKSFNENVKLGRQKRIITIRNKFNGSWTKSMLGKKHSEEAKIKMSNSHKGILKSKEWSNKIGQSIKKYWKVHGKRHVWNEGMKGGWFEYTPNIKMKMRIKHQERLIKDGITPRLGDNEKQILDDIEPYIGFPILRQYPIDGYFVDGYCIERNMVFEIDEIGHKYRYKQKDIQRENYIKSKLNCSFIRIPTYE